MSAKDLAIAIALLLFVVGSARALIDLKSWTMNVQPGLGDAGVPEDAAGVDAANPMVAQKITSGDGYNSVLCCNITTTPVAVGPPTVKADGGFVICSDTEACADKCISLDTRASSFYATLAAQVDGGVDIKCIAGD